MAGIPEIEYISIIQSDTDYNYLKLEWDWTADIMNLATLTSIKF